MHRNRQDASGRPKASEKQPVVLVTGDLIRDRVLARTIGAPSSYFGRSNAEIKTRVSGAWYLAELIKAACPDCQVYRPNGSTDDSNLSPGVKSSQLATSCALWQPFDRESGSKKERKSQEKRWRMAEFLGCVRPDEMAQYDPLYKYMKPLKDDDATAASLDLHAKPTEESKLNPRLVVIYDRGLGFSDNAALWPEMIRNDKLNCEIVLKTILPSIKDGMPKKRSEQNNASSNDSLWNRLIEKHKERLTVVLSAESLRVGQVALSHGLSWEQTFEDLDRAFRSHPLLKELAKAKRVVIHFTGAGVAVYTQSGSLGFGPELFVYDPDQLEGDWRAHQEGMIFGATSILTAAIARYTLDCKNYPLYNAVVRALKATRFNHEEGGGSVEGKDVGKVLESLFRNNRNRKQIEVILNHPEITEKIIEGILSKSEYSEEVANWLKHIKSHLNPKEIERYIKHLGEIEISSRSNSQYNKKSDIKETIKEKFEALRDAHDKMARAVEEIREEIKELGDLLEAKEPFYPEYGFFRASPAFLWSPQNLLLAVIGTDYESVLDKAKEVVLRGVSKTLERVPKGRYGNYLTVDREEVERLNEIRRLVAAYRDSRTDDRPLSMAVFGPPGSGKSFAIKELAKEILGENRQELEFNLSQFGDWSDLHEAFHQVSSKSLGGKIPLVFWDEFDVDNLKWLKDFLAPMQDAKFRASRVNYDLGKAIFVFAGGTRPTFKAFDRSDARDLAERRSFSDVKGPDFIGRLRGYVNIKGPNPVAEEGEAEEGEAKLKKDIAHLIRRAILLRMFLQRYHPYVIDAATEEASVAENIIEAFLRAEKYRYGTRSLEAIVKNSVLEDTTYFGPDALPSRDLLRLHVTKDFIEEVRRGERVRMVEEERLAA